MIEVRTLCTVHGPAEDVARFSALPFRFNPFFGLIFDFRRVLPPPAIFDELFGNQGDQGIYLMAASEGRPVPSFVKIDYVRRALLKVAQHEKKSEQQAAAECLVRTPRFARSAEIAARAYAEHGCTSQEDWQIEHWGTVDQPARFTLYSLAPLSFSFITIDAFPNGIFRRLGEMFPTLSFECACYAKNASFAGRGFFNPGIGQEPFRLCEATEEIRTLVCGWNYQAGWLSEGEKADLRSTSF